MLNHLARVVFNPVDERGLTTPQHWEAQRVQARAVDDATFVAQVALLIDDWQVEPAVIGAEASCPDDRADLATPEVDLQTRGFRHTRRLEALGRLGAERPDIRSIDVNPLIVARDTPVVIDALIELEGDAR